MNIKNVWERLRKYWTILLVFIVILFLSSIDYKKEDPIPEESVTVSVDSNSIPERESWMTDDQYLYSKMSERDFVEFASSTVDVKCPFYKLDGISYRSCLYDWEEALLSKKSVKEVSSYCEIFTAKYEDLETTPGHELFTKCRIFKASTTN